MASIEKRFSPLIGCQVYIDNKDGFLVICSKGKVFQLSHSAHYNDPCGMLLGIKKISGRKMLMVSFALGFVSIFDPKYSRII